jgi:hypothetical protein
MNRRIPGGGNFRRRAECPSRSRFRIPGHIAGLQRLRPAAPRPIESLLDAADQQMYAHKRGKRLAVRRFREAMLMHRVGQTAPW